MENLGRVANPRDIATKEYVDDQVAGKQAQTVYRAATLTADRWTAGNTQTVTVEGVSAVETAQLIQPVPAAVSRGEYERCGVCATAQAANALTFSCDAVPSADLTVYVVISTVEGATA